MKKILSVLLIFTLLCGCNLTAFAETTTSAGSQSTDVYADFVAGTMSSTIFTVDIEWSSMDFTYYEANEPVWDPVEHKYSDTESYGEHWEGTGTVTVTNHSNAPITAKPSYTALEAYSEVNMAFNTFNLLLDSAEIDNQAQIGEITVTPYGNLPEMDEKTKIGSITLTLSTLDIIEDTPASVAESNMTALDEDLATFYKSATGVENSTEIETGKYYLNYDFAAASAAVTEFKTVLADFKTGTATQKELDYAYSKVVFYRTCVFLNRK